MQAERTRMIGNGTTVVAVVSGGGGGGGYTVVYDLLTAPVAEVKGC